MIFNARRQCVCLVTGGKPSTGGPAFSILWSGNAEIWLRLLTRTVGVQSKLTKDWIGGMQLLTSKNFELQVDKEKAF